MRWVLVLVLVSAFFSPSFCSDVIVESLRELLNENSDPCDDFYRHVCPLGTSYDLIGAIMNETVFQDRIQFEVYSDSKKFPFNTSLDTISQLYIELCEEGKNTNYFLSELSNLLNTPLTYLAKDTNCQNVGAHLDDLLKSYYREDILEIAAPFKSATKKFVYAINVISLHLDNKVEDAIIELNELLEKFKDVIAKKIPETPWVKNHNITDFVLETVNMTVLSRDYGNALKYSFETLMKYELAYRSCKQRFENRENAELFCFVLTSASYEGETLKSFGFFDYGNAFNGFPNLKFGYPFYYMAKNVEEMAAKLGALGQVIGHELSHSLIKGEHDFVQTYFSPEAVDCIQNQFNSTCNVFMEDSCEVSVVQLDENGSDILGIQIAYSVLEKFYGNHLYHIYEPLNVTYQQLFFYSASLFFCHGVPGRSFYQMDGSLDGHSAANVRINVMANHPAFKEAFQCSDDSRMVKSATSQCNIFGENAPLNKHRRQY